MRPNKLKEFKKYTAALHYLSRHYRPLSSTEEIDRTTYMKNVHIKVAKKNTDDIVDFDILVNLNNDKAILIPKTEKYIKQ